MPFTPFHFGPGLLFKSISPARFSFTAFVATQVVIDFETLYFLVRQEWPVHRFLHSVPGSLLAGLVTWVLVRAAGALLLRTLASPAALIEDLKPVSVAIGCGIGGVSHAVLDNVMHDDSRLLYPIETPGLQGLVGLEALHIACVASGVVAMMLLVWRFRRAG